jgi:hypothetical protein
MTERKVFVFFSIIIVLVLVGYFYYVSYFSKENHPCSYVESDSEVLSLYDEKLEHIEGKLFSSDMSQFVDDYSYCGSVASMLQVRGKKEYFYISIKSYDEDNLTVVNGIIDLFIKHDIAEEEHLIQVSNKVKDGNHGYEFTIEEYMSNNKLEEYRK